MRYFFFERLVQQNRDWKYIFIAPWPLRGVAISQPEHVDGHARGLEDSELSKLTG